MSTKSYTSCIRIAGAPIIPPLVTPEVREKCLEYKLIAIEREKSKKRKQLFKQCLQDLEQLETKTKDLAVQTTLENQLVFGETQPVVPSRTNKLLNLTSETIEVSEYSDDGVKIIEKEELVKPQLIRSNSYTLESPSPVLLAHLEREARKCMELNDEFESLSISPITIIDSEQEPPLVETDIAIEKITISTPQDKPLDPELLEVLAKLPANHANHIFEILTKQDECNRTIQEKLDEDKSVVSISSQSLYYSTISPDTTRGSPTALNIINLKTIKNRFSESQAAAIITAYTRGYLVRRLIRTERVQSLINTIKDAILCAVQLHEAEVIEEADVELHRRLIQQVSAACYAFHDIFFTLSVKEKMGIIALDRQRKKEKAMRPLSGLSATSSSLSLSRRSTPKLIK